jgi:hypothetical protein
MLSYIKLIFKTLFCFQTLRFILLIFLEDVSNTKVHMSAWRNIDQRGWLDSLFFNKHMSLSIMRQAFLQEVEFHIAH